MDKNKEKKSKINEARISPNNFEAEQSVLGSILIDEEAALLAISNLRVEDFYNDTHKIIFKSMKLLYDESKPIDFITVSDELQKNDELDTIGGIDYIKLLTNFVPSAASCQYYLDIVKRESILRQIINASNTTINLAYNSGADENVIGKAEKLIYDIAERGYKGSLEKIKNPLEKVIDKFESIHRDPTTLRGLKTGFYQLDRVTNGLQKSDLIIIAARPGVGKTSLAMNIVSNAAINSHAKCAIFSFEMGKEQLVQRMLCSVANVPMVKALSGKMDNNEWSRIFDAEKQLKEAEIYIDDNVSNTPSQILSKCRKFQREKGLDLVVIDYIGLMHSDKDYGGNRQNEVASISRSLKLMAKDLQVPVLTLSQLNRSVESRDDGKPGKPVLSDLRESGQIEQDADMVWFIHRDMTAKEIEENNKNNNGSYLAELIIAKFRNGQTGSIWLNWDGSRTSFVNLEKDANEQSMVAQYENIEDGKNARRMKKNAGKTAEDFKNTINGIINNMDADDFMGNIPQPEFAPIGEDFVPPPEPSFENENSSNSVPDFSNVEIPSDDELF